MKQKIRKVICFCLAAVMIGILGYQGQENQVKAAEKNQETTICRLPTVSESDVKAAEKNQETTTEYMDLVAQNQALPSVCGQLQVKGTKLCDRYGNPIQLRGLSTHGIAWFPDYINESCFSEFRTDWNINVIRLALYTAEYGGYCSGGDKEALKELVQKGVEYAVKQDLYVVIDWHILSDGNPAVYQEEAKKFFAEMAEKYADCPNVLYEICNEPNGQTSWADIKKYAKEVISVIRSKDEDGVILVGTPNWSQYVDQAAQDPITEYSNIMYTLHFYAATHKESLRKTMTEAVNAGLPIFVSEFGICDASGNGAVDLEQARQWIKTMDDYNISYIAWNISNKDETSAILKKDCQKKSGFEAEDFSESGKWLYQMFTSKEVDRGDGGRNSSADLVYVEEEKRQQEVFVQSKGSFSYEIVPYTSWEAEGKVFYQYGVKVKNNLETGRDGWQISIPFNQTIVLQDGWNGNYSVEGTVLTITSKEYNGQISGGGVLDGVGFIVSGSAGLKPIQ